MQDWSSSELFKRMASRRSVRRFEDRPVPRELVERLLEAALTAPSAANKQPWRWLVVTDRGTIASLCEAVRAAVAELVGHLRAGEREAFVSYSSSFHGFESAPVLVVPLYRSLNLLSHLLAPETPAPVRATVAALERDSALASTAMAIQNLLLMAPELGLGATVMTGPLLAGHELGQVLGVRRSWHPAALIPVGYPAEVPQPPGRKPWHQVARWIGTEEEEHHNGS